MGIKQGKFKPVLDEEEIEILGEDRPQPRGKWTKVVHDCSVPTLAEVAKAEATIGSVWTCNCSEKWKLILDKDKQARTNEFGGLFKGGSVPNSLKKVYPLQWVRMAEVEGE